MLKKHIKILQKVSHNSDYKNLSSKYFTSGDMRAVTDGYRIFAYGNEDIPDTVDGGSIRIIDDFVSHETVKDHYYPIQINKEALKEFCKQHKRHEKVPYIIDAGDFFIGINPYFLRDHIDFIGSDVVYIDPNKLRGNGDFKHYSGGIYSRNEDREAFTLPIALGQYIRIYANQAA